MLLSLSVRRPLLWRVCGTKCATVLLLTGVSFGGLMSQRAIAQITGQPTLPSTTPEVPSAPAVPNPSLITTPPLAVNRYSNASYILGAGDQVSLSVIGYPEFTGTLAVLPDGSVNLPLVGPIRASGLTPNQLSAVLTQQLMTYLVDPVVSVGLAVQRPVVVTVSGEVHRPGPLQLSGLSNSNGSTLNGENVTDLNLDSRLTSRPAIPTLSSAVLLAGGVTRDADIRQVTVRRPLANGQVEQLSFNLWEAVTSNAGLNDLALRDGDSIFIPTLVDGGIDRRTVASSSLAPSTVRVKVVGEVVDPGEIEVPPDSSLSSAVAIAGGPTTDAQLNSVSLVRLDDNGQIQQDEIDLSNLIDDYQVEEGDVIVVAKRGYLSVVDGIGRVVNPLNIFRLLGF
ncbi:MAG: polysaccharide biosynthesis/export family protein [Cyanobacteria bacterium J06560_2]